MTKYINDLVNEFTQRKNGIQNNATLWQNIPITVVIIDGTITDLESINTQIDNANTTLRQLRASAREMEIAEKKKLDQIDNFAFGLHVNDAPKLLDYGITLKKAPISKPIPTKGMVKNITDDHDGEGFILERDSLHDADNYEWQKVSGTDAAITNIDENSFIHFKITKKPVFVDDDVRKGVRYFYKFRGFNATGNGPWSEPVSRVQ